MNTGTHMTKREVINEFLASGAIAMAGIQN
jgi:hypothetical protein